jgi:hypothetical protein
MTTFNLTNNDDTWNDDDNGNTINGLDGNDVINGHGGDDIIDGGAGSDALTGGPGTDRLTGGTGADFFLDTSAGLNGDHITDFLPGDRIQITDLDSSTANIALAGSTLSYSDGSGHSGSVQIENVGPGRLVVRAISGGGTEIRLQDAAHNDFNGDGRSDLLLRNDNGTVTDWLATPSGGFMPNSQNFQIQAPPSWHVTQTGDFNGDGRVDLMWRSDDGTVTNWLGTANGGFTDNWNAFNVNAGSSWQIIQTGDFNGDGRDDLVWQSTDGTITNWLAKSDGGFTDNWNNFNIQTNASWQIIGTGDFNGDGRTDLLWQGADGTVTNWLGTPSGGFTQNWNNFNIHTDASWRIIGSGDFNGDGRDDILWQASDGTVTNWSATASGGFTDNWNNFNTHTDGSWQIAGIGDVNGDAIDDLLWRNTSTGQLTDWLGTANGGFVDNWNNAATPLATTWHPQPHDTFL